MQSQFGAQRPTPEVQWQGNLGAKIDASQQAAGVETRLSTRQARDRGIERPEQRQMPKRSIYAGELDARCMQNANGIKRRRVGQRSCGGIDGLEEVLVTLDHAAKREAFVILGQEKLRFDF